MKIEPLDDKQERRSKFAPLLLLALFGLALGVRVIGLTWGLPNAGRWYSYHPDESWHQMAGAVLRIARGDGWNPHFFNYPSLHIYATYFSYLLLNAFGATTPAPDANAVWPTLRDILLAGRLVTAFLGALTVLPLFGLARQMGGVRVAILAALLFALLPGHVQHSHFATVDVPATFFIVLCLWLSARALETHAPDDKWRGKQLLWAALVAGLAAATKYNAGLVVVAPLMALLFNRRKGAVKLGAAIVAIALVGFLIGCPFSVLDSPSFWGDGLRGGQNGFAYELFVHPKQGSGDLFTNTGNGWWYHATFNLPFVMTWPLLLASVAGIAGTVVKRREEGAVFWIPLSFAGLYFLTLGFSQVRFMRYVLPLAPVLCIFAALGVRQIGLWLRTPKAAPMVAALLGLTALVGASNVLFPLVSVDPRDQAADWLRAQTLNQGAPVVVGLVEKPWFYTPPLSPLNALDSPALITGSPDGRFRFEMMGFNAPTFKPQWVVLNDFEWRDKARLHDAAYDAFKQWLDKNYVLAAHFQNRPPLELPGRAFVAYDFLYTNPETRLYRRLNAP